MSLLLSRRALDLFEEALCQPDETRAAWLAAACAGEPALEGEVARLMRADAGQMSQALSDGLETLRSLGPAPERVGAYRITALLGVGGMGATYAAERADGLFEQAVAIKLVLPSLLPETSRALFETERRALAKLSHRNIAQLFDGGVTPSGAPYFVMERIEGGPLDVHCADKSVREIVRLLIDVCAGVRDAHQNLVVHADLKPSNVLMSAAGDPKIIDFGVARLLAEEDAAAVAPLTADYASPERLAGGAPVPADDIYALGAMLRALTAEKHAEARADLDAVIARATAPAAARYPSVESLQHDLQRWLDFRPLAARLHDRGYVARKFVRRRRLRVIAAAILACGLVTALAVTSALYVQAEHQRRLAEARFDEVRALARYLLFDVYGRLERTPNSLVTRRDVAGVAHRYLEQLARSPGAPAALRLETIESLIRIADIQAGRNHANLGEFDAAKHNLHTAESIARSLPQDEALAAQRARIAVRQANIAMNVDHALDTAARFLNEAQAFAALSEPGSALHREVAAERGALMVWQGDYAPAAALVAAHVAAAEAAAATSREAALLAMRLHDVGAEASYYQDDLAAAEASYRRYVALADALAARDPGDVEALRETIRARWALGTTLLSRARAEEALALLNEASARTPRLVQFEPQDEASGRMQQTVLAARAQALAMAGRFREGERALRGQIDARRGALAAQPGEAAAARRYGIALAMLADLHADYGSAATACALYRDAVGVFGGMEGRGQLTPHDRSVTLGMISDRRARHCGAVPAQ